MSWPAKIIRISFYLLFILVPFVFLSNTSELFEFNKMLVTYILTVIITASWIIQMLLERRPIFKRTLLDWPIFIFLITQSLSLLFSINIRTSLFGYYSRFNGGLVSLACYSLLYWAFVTFMDRASTKKVIQLSLATALVVAFFASLEHFGHSLSCLLFSHKFDVACWVQDVQNRVFFSMGQPNWLAAYILGLIFIPMAIGLETKKDTLRQIYYFSATLLLFFCLLCTKSRSGILAFGISSAVFWGYYFYKNSTRVKYFLTRFLLFNVLFLLLSFSFSNAVRDYFIKPISSTTVTAQGTVLENGGTESGSIRKIVWTGAIRIWLDGPKNFLIGSGPETFGMAYYQHRPIEHNNTSEWELLYNKAHNEFLNYLATTGLFGFTSYLFLLGAMVYTFIKSQANIKPQNPNKKNLEIVNCKLLIPALLAGWLTIPFTNFWGFSVVMIQILMFLLPALAITQNIENLPVKPKVLSLLTRQIISILGIISIAGFLLFSIVRYWAADTKYATGELDLKYFSKYNDASFIISAYDNLSQAYDLNQADSAISSDFGVVTAYVAVLAHDSDATTSSELASASMVISQKAINDNPYHPNYYKSKARAAIILSSIEPKYLDTALEALQQAAKISPTDPRIPFNLGVVADYAGRKKEAVDYFNASLKLKPDFADPRVQLEQLATVSGKLIP